MSTAGDTEHAAILFADVKGYSVLISRDEVGTYERLRRARALFQALVGDYGGRIVDEAGDGVLAAFPDAGKAVDFALAVQHDLANAAAWQGEIGPFAFRMGIHVGPVHRDGDRLYGKTLIIAQRIQEVAPPGRVCVSDSVREFVETRRDLRCIGLGMRQLKILVQVILDMDMGFQRLATNMGDQNIIAPRAKAFYLEPSPLICYQLLPGLPYDNRSAF